MQVFVGCGAADAYGRSAEPRVVPSEVGIETRCGHVGCGVAKQFVGKPPAPCGQIVLHADVIPGVRVLALSFQIEVVAVAKVEISDKRFLTEIPRQGAAGGHES